MPIEPRGGVVCTNCGTAYPPSATAPLHCRICDDERVAKPPVQQWTTKGDLLAAHATEMRACEPGLSGIGVAPTFAIGQRALLVEQRDGCVLWDCLPFVDEAAVDYVRARGGLKAIAISHPHFYGAMADWSRAFGDVPVYVHAFDRDWVVDAPSGLTLWTGDAREIAPGVTLVRCGGHFDGGTVMHVAAAAAGRGALLGGDVIMVGQHGRGVSFMHSYPGYIPLRRDQIRHLASSLEPYAFEAIYGFSWPRVIAEGGASIVARTARRFLETYAS